MVRVCNCAFLDDNRVVFDDKRAKIELKKMIILFSSHSN